MNAKTNKVQTEDLNLAEMSDDEINNLDPTRLENLEDKEESKQSSSSESSERAQSAAGSESEDNAPGESGGADPEDKSSTEEAGGADSTSVEEEDETSTESQTGEADEQNLEDDQSEKSGSEAKPETTESTGEPDYKTEFSKLMAPFKAAKREIKLDNPEDARRLMQMGVDYARKMEEMKPFRRVLKTLENADLIDIDKINFLIDLNRKDPAAIKKLLKDSEIDPIDLDLEDGGDYKPNDHTVSDNEIDLDDVLNEIRGTPSFERTIEVVTKEWDKASQKLLMDNPGILRHMNMHVETGLYDQIINKVTMERTLGRLPGMSDLEAYKAVGDAMLEKGELVEPNSSQSSPAGNTNNQGGSHPTGSEASIKARKRAASPTKGSASTGKKVPDFSKMTDEQIEKFDINAL